MWVVCAGGVGRSFGRFSKDDDPDVPFLARHVDLLERLECVLQRATARLPTRATIGLVRVRQSAASSRSWRMIEKPLASLTNRTLMISQPLPISSKSGRLSIISHPRASLRRHVQRFRLRLCSANEGANMAPAPLTSVRGPRAHHFSIAGFDIARCFGPASQDS